MPVSAATVTEKARTRQSGEEIENDLAGRRKEADERGAALSRDKDARGGAGGREEQALDEELAERAAALPAPRARRTAISRCREAARASRRLAKIDAGDQEHEQRRSPSESTGRRRRRDAKIPARGRRGRRRSSPRPATAGMVARRARACSMLTPGLRRPPTSPVCHVVPGRSSAIAHCGVQTGTPQPSPGPQNCGSSTPAIWKGCPLSVKVLPMTSGRPPCSRCQKAPGEDRDAGAAGPIVPRFEQAAGDGVHARGSGRNRRRTGRR